MLARDTATANNAERQKVTYEDLFKRGLIPRDQYETQRASNDALQATLAADRAAVENAKLNLAYTQITAPISGRTGASAVHVGDLVRANDATPLVVINQVSPIYVSFAVPGRYLGDIRRFQAQRPLVVTARGQAMVAPGAQAPAPPPPASQAQQVAPGQGATVAVPAGLVETGRVSFIDNAVDPTTGTIKLKGTFQNASQGLWPGLFVTVMLNLTTDENVARGAGDRGAAVGVGTVRLRGQCRSHRAGAAGDRRAAGRRGHDHRARACRPARKSSSTASCA